jgi:pimeloyl-ACP methyl ester carboxylesterase
MIEDVTGRYAHVTVGGTTYRTYFEEAGDGIPLVCLHTAGADSREYRHMLGDPDITRDYRVIAFDLPAHGRSQPLPRWWESEYKLTREFYTGFIAAFCDALELERPALVGCSMGGYVMLDLAHEQPGRYRALIGVQTRAYAPAWTALAPIVQHPEVDWNSCRTLVHAVCSPASPEELAQETVWIYASNGPDVMAGDFHYAAEDHDARWFLAELDAAELGLYVIGGDDDPSCLPAHTEELARRVKNLEVTRIPDCGHFPPSENPEVFKAALMPILDAVRERPLD